MIFGDKQHFAIELTLHDDLLGTDAYNQFANFGIWLSETHFGCNNDTVWLKHFLGNARWACEINFSSPLYREYFNKYWEADSSSKIFIYMASKVHHLKWSFTDINSQDALESRILRNFDFTAIGDSYFMDHFIMMAFQVADDYVEVGGHILDTNFFLVQRVKESEFHKVVSSAIEYASDVYSSNINS